MSKLIAQMVDALMFALMRISTDLQQDGHIRPRDRMPDLEQREAVSWFDGWWTGIAVGSVIGTGLTVVLFTSGVMA